MIVGAKFPGRGLGPLGHMARTRLSALGKSQKVKFFIAKITKEDLAVMQELLDSGQVKSVIDRRTAERRSRGAGLPGRGARARKSRPDHVADP